MDELVEPKRLLKLEHRIDTWPEMLKEIAGMIGVEGTCDLVREYGGRKLYFPERLRDGHHLVRAIGRRFATRLCQHYTRERHRIPANRTYMRWFDARVYAIQGKKHREISKLIGVTTNHVGELLAGFNPADYEAIAETPAVLKCPGCGRRVAVPRAHFVGPTNQLDFGFPAR
jgi:hypothetical protein